MASERVRRCPRCGEAPKIIELSGIVEVCCTRDGHYVYGLGENLDEALAAWADRLARGVHAGRTPLSAPAGTAPATPPPLTRAVVPPAVVEFAFRVAPPPRTFPLPPPPPPRRSRAGLAAGLHAAVDSARSRA